MMQGKLLLTGATGMVGRNILEHSATSKWEILSPGRNELDLTNYQEVVHYVQRLKPDYIVHAAGQVGGIQANLVHPVDFLITNLDVGRNVVLAAQAAGVKRLINLASSCMYPRNARNPLNEGLLLTGELEPTNEGYALAKIVITRLCAYINQENSDLKYKTLIPCNLYGRHDKFAPEHSHLIPAIVHKLHLAKINGNDVVDIWGDGTARREFMYAADLADAIMCALADFDLLPQQMNIGAGEDYSINDYYSIAAEVIGWNGRFEHDLSKPVGMKQKLISTERQAVWGWKPTTSLQDGIAATYEFYRESIKL